MSPNKFFHKSVGKSILTRVPAGNPLSSARSSILDFQQLALPVKDGFDFADIKNVIRCQSANNCTVVYTKGGKKYVSFKSTKEFELILPESKFFRIHHSEIVNIDFVKKYYKEGRGGYVELTDGTSVPVAHRRKDDFLSKLESANKCLTRLINFFVTFNDG